MKVDFMIIGAMKSGTTSLAYQISQHPEVCFCRNKEPQYFSTVKDWRAQLSNYHSLYSPHENQKCGEASTSYTFLPEYLGTYDRLFEYNPNLKLIYIMRQPVERIISHYAHRLLHHDRKTPIEKVILSSPGYINRSRYGVQILPYVQRFGRENVLLLLFEDFVRSQNSILNRVFEFIGVSRNYTISTSTGSKNRSVGKARFPGWYYRLSSGASIGKVIRLIPEPLKTGLKKRFTFQLEEKPSLSDEFKQLLWNFLEDDVCQIEALMERRLYEWRVGYEGYRSNSGYDQYFDMEGV